MKKIQQIAIATVLALVTSSTAFAGNITMGVAGHITMGVAGNITMGIATDIVLVVVGLIG